MIVPMKKVTLIVQAKDADSAVDRLRATGVLHVEHIRTPAGRDIDLIKEDSRLLDEAMRILAGIGFTKRSSGTTNRELTDRRFAPLAGVNARRIIDLWKRRERLKDYSRSLIKGISDWKDWGDFEPGVIHKLAENSIYIRLYQIPERQIKDIPADVVVERISRAKGMLNCAVIACRKIEIPFKEITLPRMGLERMQKRLAENERTISAIHKTLEGYFPRYGAFMQMREKLEKEREFQEAVMGMGALENIGYIKGYLPQDNTEAILAAARKERWGIVIEEPSEEDRVPTLIRNPRGVAILSPLFRMLEIFPGYRELDISLWFLIFLSVFFGMLIGDAGYGVIYLLLSFWARKKWGAQVRQTAVFGLFYLLSLSAIIWGLLSGTFFGQEWLPNIAQPLIPALRSNKNVQTLCFFIGALHLSIAHLWRALIKSPSPAALADMGWVCILWGVYFLAKTLILGDAFPVFGRVFFITGACLVLFFSSPQRNILKGIGKGLGNLLLNLVNNFTDVVSYIRLFAVGLATVAVADSFNKMAAEVGYNGILSGLLSSLILFSGHTLNILLGPMSVLVHGVRLNVLEFCNHLDIKWSGFPYRPLKE